MNAGSAFVPGPGWVAPFAVMLFAIAILPLLAPAFWESNLRKLAVGAALGLPVFVLYLRHDPAALAHTGGDYLSFMALLASLFIVSGGVLVTGDIQARPAVNTAFLGVGAVLASLVGTTGASVLLIRPLLATNEERRHVAHTVVFFIFVVANIGGCLTPLGDPPLFLGYLLGVPFTWTLRLSPHWLLANGMVLAVYYFWDRRAYAREDADAIARDETAVRPIRVAGKRNLVLLLAVVASVAFLHAHCRELGLTEPWQFFWATGFLSSFLDNAPTYLTFVAIAQSLGLPPEVAGMSHRVLAAISVGAVFMGANTYIGNGPNFMVLSIAQERGVKMPSFGGYMLYSGAVLIPVFVVVTLVFFR